MTRPIDADAFRKWLCALFAGSGTHEDDTKEEEEWNVSLARIITHLDEAPTVERPHGEWKVYSHCSDGFKYKCSLCGRVVNEGHWFEQKEILSVYPYCHCGAKMVAVEDPIKWYFGVGFKYLKVGDTIYTQDDDKQGWTGKEGE